MKDLQCGIANGIYLRSLTPDDVSAEYVSWLNDPETTKYLESRHITHTRDSCHAFVKQAYESENNALLGIYQNGSHVGNIKIGNIHSLYRHADIGLMIGRPYWGRGVATASIALAEEIAFKQLKLHKLFAGAYKDNTGSVRAFLRNGWKLAGEMKDQCIVNGKYTDSVWLEKLNRRLDLRTVTGHDADILFQMANDPAVRENSLNTNAITWPEHKKWLESKLQNPNCHFYIASDAEDCLIGQIRVDIEEDTGVISFSVAAASRGKGYGTQLLKEINKLREQGIVKSKHIVGRVKHNNTASRYAFLHAGFIERNLADYDEYWYPHLPEGQ